MNLVVMEVMKIVFVCQRPHQLNQGFLRAPWLCLGLTLPYFFPVTWTERSFSLFICILEVQFTFLFQYSTDVLNTFKSYKVDSISGSRQRKTNDENEQFFAKYLTNQNLLQLQLSDSNFRRYILIQFLILFQYLKSTVKFKR